MPTFIRLTDYRSSAAKEEGFFKSDNIYKANQDDFEKIPGNPIVFWLSESVISTFNNNKIYNYAFSDGKNVTGKNDTYLKQLWEVNGNNIGLNQKWLFMMKGGEYRKWYGNIDYVINWSDEARVYYRKSKIGRLIPEYLWYQQGITWSKISSKKASFRLLPEVCTFDEVNITLNNKDDYYSIFAFLNTTVANHLLEATNQTLSIQTENILNLPKIFSKSKEIKLQIDQLSQQNIDISKQEWDSRETSWDFTKNELLKHKQDGSIESALITYSNDWSEQFKTLHSNEEELNRLFIEIYGLEDELDEYVEFTDITILKNETKIAEILIPPSTKEEADERDKTAEGYLYNRGAQLDFQNPEIIKQFISYSVGCMLGRYSLDEDSLIVANLNQEIPTDTTYEIDDDNIIPIVDESDYFSDDMTDRFTEFVRTTFGSEKLQQNIAFIETSIGKKLRTYFQKDFYIDHTKRYKKRPIYWLFSSPKGTFQTLIYMHRYTPDTLNNILNDYLRPFRIRLDTMREESMRITESESSSSRDKTDADKKIDKIDKTLDDINEYEKTLAHYAAMRIEIDLDDGVKVNYCKFKELLFEFDKKLCK